MITLVLMKATGGQTTSAILARSFLLVSDEASSSSIDQF